MLSLLVHVHYTGCSHLSPLLRYLSLPTDFLETRYSVISHSISIVSDSLVRALNGETLLGQYQCTLASGTPIVAGSTYNVLSDFSSCNTVGGGFRFAGLSTSINQNYLYSYRGNNERCSVIYGPLATQVSSEPLLVDPLFVGGGVYVRLGDAGCDIDDSCVYVPRGDSVCNNPSPTTNRAVTIPVYVTDPDGLDNTNFVFSLAPGQPTVTPFFAVNSSTGQLYLLQEIDRDNALSFFNVSVQVTDGTFSDQFSIEVTIEDVNDNSPIPTSPLFEGSVRENEDPLTLVLTVTFTDNDDGSNAQLIYSLPPTALVDFIISNTSGEIFTARVFDYEDGQNEYLFNVTARDGGGREGTSQVRITIRDRNDNRPTVIVVPTGTAFVEDSPPIIPASVTVEDRDSSIHAMFFAFVIVENNLDGEDEILSIDTSLLPPTFKLWSSIGSAGIYENSTVLLLVGGDSPQTYTTLLSAVTYDNQAELITRPLDRTITYRVCDTFTETTFGQLSLDTQLAISPPDTPTTRDLTDEEAELLISDCTAANNAVNSTAVDLVEANDRPQLIRAVVQYPPIREDISASDNRGQYVVETFEGVIFDPDRQPYPSDVAVTGIDSSTAQPTFAVLANDQNCRARSNQIVANGSYACASRLVEGGPCYCPDRVGYTLTCYEYQDTVFMFCLSDNICSICQCSPPSTTSDLSAVSVDFGAGSIDISQLLQNQFFIYEFTDTNQLYNFTFGFASLIFTRTDASTVISMFTFDVTFEAFGAVSDESALLLGCYTLVRWNPVEHQTGSSSFSFRAWDRTNGLQPGERGANSTDLSDSAFSLASGIATIEVTPVNDPPQIRLGGPGEDQQNYITTYTEGTSVFISSMDAVIIELDQTDNFLFNLSVFIAPVGGECDLPDYEGMSDDRLSYMDNNMIPVIVTQSTEGQACILYEFNGALSVDQWRAYLTMIRFRVDNDEPSEHTRQLAVVISDLVSTSPPSFTTLVVNLVSDLCPVLQVPTSGTPLVYTEHSGPLVLSSTINVTDPDRLAMIEGAVVEVMATTTNPCRGCVLSVNTGSTGITSTLSSSNLTITLSGLATPTSYQEVLRTVSFEDTSAEPTFDLIMIRFTVQDPQVTSAICVQAVGEIGVMIEHVNDNSPDLYLNYPLSEDFTTVFMEGAGPVAVTGGMVEIRDLDGVESSVYIISVVITSGCFPSEDSLQFAAPPPTTVTLAYNSTTCSMSLLGNSDALESDLGRLQYTNLNIDNPTINVRSISFTITDGSLQSRSSVTEVTITAINDAPMVDLDTSNSVSSDSMVTMILGTGSVALTGDNQGNIIDPDTDNLISLTLVLTEIDSTGVQVDPRSDVDFESVQSTEGPFIAGLGLGFQYLQGMGELRITGQASVGEWSVCMY